jgi:hypothetical protein
MDQLGERRHKTGIVVRLLSRRPRFIKGYSDRYEEERLVNCLLW